jgi:hypothetical protein
LALVLLLLAVMWIGAGVYYFRGRPESRSADSIGSFRRQLRVLERTSPTMIDPAHRLRDGAPGMLFGPVASARPSRRTVGQTPVMAAAHRRQVMKRRRDIFFGLVLGVVGALGLGLVPGLRVMWLLAGFLVLVLAAYMALLVALRNEAAERATKVRFLPAAVASADQTLLLRRSAN